MRIAKRTLTGAVWCFTVSTLAGWLGLALPSPTQAALRTWQGGNTDVKWSTPTNWVGNVAPVAGDDLWFPIGGVQASHNDFPAGRTFNSLIFSGALYSLDGNSIALNAGIVATNGTQNTINNLIILNSNQTFTIHIGSASFFLPNAIDTNGKDLTFDVSSGTLVQLQAVISGAGGLIKTGPGSVLMYASNTFSGPVQLNQGGIGIYNGNALGATNGSTTIASGATLSVNNIISVPEPLVLSGTLLSSAPGQILTGPMTLAASNATIQGASGASLSVNAVISGEGGFTKAFPGTLILNSNNSYTGLTTVAGGTLFLNGNQPNSPILLTGNAIGTAFGGTGTVATITSTATLAAALTPGASTGILTCSNLALNPFTAFRVELNGTAPGTGYDQLNVNGSVALSNALLSVTLGYTPSVGDTFVILNNNGPNPVLGTFGNWTNGAVMNLNGYPFQISYTGGTGNDITLTRISPPTHIASITVLTNGLMQLSGTGGLAGFTNIIQSATNLNPVIQWTNLGGAVADSTGAFSFTDTNAPLFPLRFYRVLSP